MSVKHKGVQCQVIGVYSVPLLVFLQGVQEDNFLFYPTTITQHPSFGNTHYVFLDKN
ncbi:hypothetical protein NIES4103_48860 [Nostoc sp. NIES-4103]|nr:hypothetical protein NIES4103_48860 [Nostoc sp. NIES-4103]